MIHMMRYHFPIGDISIASKDNKLVGLWIEGQKHFLSTIKDVIKESFEEPILLKKRSD